MILKLSRPDHVRVITVTLNPVLDKTLLVQKFEAGKTFLADRSDNYAGGKGVNVSRALLKFGIQSIATGIIGNKGNDTYLAILSGEGIHNDFLTAGGYVRTSVTIVSMGRDDETHIREKGPHISFEMVTRLKAKLKITVQDKPGPEGTIVVFSGSLPAGLPADTYSELIRSLEGYGTSVFLDASAEALRDGIRARPLYIKPNEQEVDDALGFLPKSKQDFIRAFGIFHDMGIKQVMISRGKNGLLYSVDNRIIRASVDVDNPINTVGSGDAAVAGSVLGSMNNLTPEETARLACAMGSANTLIAGGCNVNREDVTMLYERATVEYL
jgi:1-phosphofructokinase family hexose kinase